MRETFEIDFILDNPKKDTILSVTIDDSEYGKDQIYTPNSQQYKIKDITHEAMGDTYRTYIKAAIRASNQLGPRTITIRNVEYLRDVINNVANNVAMPEDSDLKVVNVTVENHFYPVKLSGGEGCRLEPVECVSPDGSRVPYERGVEEGWSLVFSLTIDEGYEGEPKFSLPVKAQPNGIYYLLENVTSATEISVTGFGLRKMSFVLQESNSLFELETSQSELLYGGNFAFTVTYSSFVSEADQAAAIVKVNGEPVVYESKEGSVYHYAVQGVKRDLSVTVENVAPSTLTFSYRTNLDDALKQISVSANTRVRDILAEDEFVKANRLRVYDAFLADSAVETPGVDNTVYRRFGTSYRVTMTASELKNRLESLVKDSDELYFELGTELSAFEYGQDDEIFDEGGEAPENPDDFGPNHIYTTDLGRLLPEKDGVAFTPELAVIPSLYYSAGQYQVPRALNAENLQNLKRVIVTRPYFDNFYGQEALTLNFSGCANLSAIELIAPAEQFVPYGQPQGNPTLYLNENTFKGTAWLANAGGEYPEFYGTIVAYKGQGGEVTVPDLPMIGMLFAGVEISKLTLPLSRWHSLILQQEQLESITELTVTGSDDGTSPQLYFQGLTNLVSLNWNTDFYLDYTNLMALRKLEAVNITGTTSNGCYSADGAVYCENQLRLYPYAKEFVGGTLEIAEGTEFNFGAYANRENLKKVEKLVLPASAIGLPVQIHELTGIKSVEIRNRERMLNIGVLSNHIDIYVYGQIAAEYRKNVSNRVINLEAVAGGFEIEEGVLWHYLGEQVAELTLPENVTGLAPGFLRGYPGVTMLIMPRAIVCYLADSNGSIQGAIPDHVTAIRVLGGTEIPAYAFNYQCASVTSLELPDTIETVGDYAFAGLSLTRLTLPSKISVLPQNLLQGGYLRLAETLTEIKLPENITELPSGFFYGYEKLERVDFGAGSKLTAIGDNVFSKCAALTELTLPDNIANLNITAIAGAVNLAKLRLPAALTELPTGFIEEHIFPKLTEITFGENARLTTIADNAIKAKNLVSFAFPDSVTAIGSSAFSGCVKLKIDRLPANLRTLGSYAFGGATVKDLLEVPESLTSMFLDSFSNETRLKFLSDLPCELKTNPWTQSVFFAVVPQSGYEAYRARWANHAILYSDGWLDADGYVVERTGGEVILHNYFGSQRSLTLPGEVTRIAGDFSKLDAETVILPDGLLYMDYEFKLQRGALSDCPNLTEIRIPASVREMSGAFDNCPKLAVVTAEEGLRLENVSGFAGTPYRENIQGCVILGGVLFGYNDAGTDAKLVIPEGVRVLSAYDFAEIYRVTEVWLPESIESVREAIGLPMIASVTFFGNLPLAAAFSHSNKITSVKVLEGATALAAECFKDLSALASVELPAGLKSLGDRAFMNCSALTGLSLPESLEELGQRTFQSCTGLTSVDLSPLTRVTAIGESCFAECGLTSVTLPANVVTISDSAFYGNKLTAIALPEGLTTLGDFAFSGSPIAQTNFPQTLKTIGRYAFSEGCFEEAALPEGVTQVGDYAFSYNPNLTRFSAPAGAALGRGVLSGCSAIKSIVYSGAVKLSDLVSTSSIRVSPKTVTILPGVTQLAEGMFAGYTSLSSVTLPEGIVSIGKNAFNGCYGIAEISLPQTLISVGESAFVGTGLKEVVFPAALRTIGKSAFATSSLNAVTFPEGVESIGDYAFDGAYLASLTLPDSLLTLGEYALKDNARLTELRLGKNVILKRNTLSGCVALADLTLPGNQKYGLNSNIYLPASVKRIKVTDGVTRIAEYAFDGFYPLESFSLPESVLRVESYAFRNFATDFILPASLEYVGSSAFAGSALSGKLELPNIREISHNAFSGCNRLTEAILPDSLTALGSSVFADCVSLRKLALPNLSEPQPNVAKGCVSLEDLTIPGGQLLGFYFGYNTLFPDGDLTSGIPVEIPQSLTTLRVSEGCRMIVNSFALGIYHTGKIREVILPGSLVSIGGSAFAKNPVLARVVMREGLEKLASGVFADCESLFEATLPVSLTDVAGSSIAYYNNVFRNSPVKKLTCSGAFGATYLGLNALEELIISEGVTQITGEWNLSTLARVTLPASLAGIGARAFYNCSALTQISLPQSLREIKNSAFSCSGLTSISLPEGLESIGESAFENCAQLAAATLPQGLSTLGAKAFANCAALTAFAIPLNVSVGQDALAGCSGITELTVAGETGAAKLGRLTKLETLRVAEGTHSVAAGAFSGLGIKRAFLPEGLTSIGSGAFRYNSALAELSFPDSLVAIGDFAFDGTAWYDNLPNGVSFAGKVLVKAKNMTAVDYRVPAGTTQIYSNAFYACSSLVYVDLGDSLTRVGANAFRACRGLLGVRLPEGLTEIADSAFAYCDRLLQLKLPESLQILGDGALNGTKQHFESLPASLKKIGANALSGCSVSQLTLGELCDVNFDSFADCKVTRFILESGAQRYVYQDGVLYNGDLTQILKVTSELAPNLTLPETLTSIPEKAFYGRQLVSISIPASVTAIGSRAFTYNTNLTSVTFAEGSQLAAIPELAFYGCGELESISLPASVASIGTNAFTSCSQLREIFMPGVTALGNSAFSGTNFSSIVLPASVKSIGSAIFSDCANLVEATLLSSSMSASMFFGCSALERVVLPEGLTAIPVGAFQGCTSLKTLRIPSGVNRIGNRAFENCEKLEAITVPEGVTTIGDYAFYGCMSLTAPEFAANGKLTAIGEYAFAESGIRKITLPDGVGTLGKRVFSGCDSLAEVSLGNSLTAIPESAFYSCFFLKTLTIPATVKTIGKAFESAGIEKLVMLGSAPPAYGGSFGAYVTICLPSSNAIAAYLASAAYKNSILYTENQLNGGSMLISGGVLKAYLGDAESLTVPEGVTEVYSGLGESSLREITLPSTLEKLGGKLGSNVRKVFLNAAAPPQLANFSANSDYLVVLPDANFDAYSSWMIARGIAVSDSEYQAAALTGCLVREGVLLKYFGNDPQPIIPQGVTRIAGSAFRRSDVVSITIPAGVTLDDGDSSDMGAFAYCYSLVSVTLQNSRIADYQFYGCKNLATVTLGSGVREIGRSAFERCSKLLSITLPANLTEIADGLFRGCASLTNLALPDNLRRIGISAFSGCGFTGFVVPEGVTEIGGDAFRDCAKLTQISLPQTLQSLGRSAFRATGLVSLELPRLVTQVASGLCYDCDYLVSVSFAGEVTLIDASAFRGCNKLSNIRIPSTVTEIEVTAFEYCSDLTQVALPQGIRSVAANAFNQTERIIYASPTPCAEPKNSMETRLFLVPADAVAAYRAAWPNQAHRVYASGANVVQNGEEYLYVSENGGYTLVYSKMGHVFDIPAEVEGLPVKAIAKGAFKHNTYTVIIPDTVEVISSGFAYGTNSQVRYFKLTGAPRIERGAFQNTQWYRDQPDGLLVLGTAVLGYKGAMPANTALVIPEGIRTIADGAFESLTNLTSVTLPESLEHLGESAFKETGIAEIALGGKVRNLPRSAFAGCVNLVSAYLSGVTEIAESAFSGCTGLRDMTLKTPAKLTQLQLSAAGIDADCVLLVPESLVESCKNQWLNYRYVYPEGSEIKRVTDGTITQSFVKLPGESFWTLARVKSAANLAAFTLPAQIPGETDAAVGKVGAYAFCGISITTLTVPEGFTGASFAEQAFAESSISAMTIQSAIFFESVANPYTAFAPISRFYVPDEALEAYRAAWADTGVDPLTHILPVSELAAA